MLHAAGVSIAVADAHRDALAVADLVTTYRRRSRRGTRSVRLAARSAARGAPAPCGNARMKGWSRALAYGAGIAVIAGAYFLGLGGRGDSGADAQATSVPDPG